MNDKWDGFREEDWSMLLEAFQKHDDTEAYNSTLSLKKLQDRVSFEVGSEIAQRLLMRYYNLEKGTDLR